MFWLFGCEACVILAPQPGIDLVPLALEGEVPAAGLVGMSPGMPIDMDCIELLPFGLRKPLGH